ncbi:hypothetical protein Tco_1133436 [Tanacetum coccineum]
MHYTNGKGTRRLQKPEGSAQPDEGGRDLTEQIRSTNRKRITKALLAKIALPENGRLSGTGLLRDTSHIEYNRSSGPLALLSMAVSETYLRPLDTRVEEERVCYDTRDVAAIRRGQRYKDTRYGCNTIERGVRSTPAGFSVLEKFVDREEE